MLIKILFDPSYLLYIELQSHVSSNRDQKITKSKHGPLPEIALYDKNVDIKFSAHIKAYDIVYHKSIYIYIYIYI